MKKLILSILVSLFVFESAHAATLEAKPVGELLQGIAEKQFIFKEVGMVFGFNSIKSCMYTNQDMVVIKNYCVPKKNYPAKGYTVISPKFGMINFYQEKLSSGLLKRDIEITVFPDILRPYLKTDLSNSTLDEMNKIIETLHYQYGPACWTTNHSWYTEAPQSKCNEAEVVDFQSWSAETQQMTLSEKEWVQIVEKLEGQFKD